MPQPIFYFEKLRLWDKVTIVLYLLLSAGMIIYYLQKPVPERGDFPWSYAFLTQLCLYIFNYKSLRNMTVYCIWIGIGIGHIGMYLYLRDLSGDAPKELRNTVILLLLFQVLRFISARTQGQELVCPGKYGTDLFEERKVTLIDYILFVLYMSGAIFLPFLI
jgi:hypothetical protein